MKLLFASHNSHKLEEVQASLGPSFQVVSLQLTGWSAEIPETEDTLLGNARLKAQTVFREYGCDCFADDTGLEIEALNGAPGVRTARFARDGATGKENREKTLHLLSGQPNRRATFRTVIVLIVGGAEHVFEGRVPGEITEKETGREGFGYDPIFRPQNSTQTYAEMPLEMRARVSHRALAVARMRLFLEARQ
jgi:XTP/dITP diphosphohydrolase